MQIHTTDEAPRSLERIQEYRDHFVLLVPLAAGYTRSTKYGERVCRDTQAWVYQHGEAYALGRIPVFQRSLIAALDQAARDPDGVLFGLLELYKRAYVIRYPLPDDSRALREDPRLKKQEAEALKVLGAAYDAWNVEPGSVESRPEPVKPATRRATK